MSQREKILAGAVGLLVVCVVAFFALNSVNASFTTQQTVLDDLELQILRKESTVALGKQAGAKLAVYQRRSLPGELGVARSQYEEWLLATTVEFFGQDKVSVKLKEGRRRDDTYTPVNFAITADGNLEQFTRFLHRFYEMDYLHRIDRVQVVPIDKSRDLKLNCDVEALSVYGAEPNKPLGDAKGNRIDGSVEDDYLSVILGRNLFGPPNNPPQLSSIRTPSVELGGSLSETITARDSDPLDSVTFRLEQYPEGMRLDGDRRAKPGDAFSARLSWRPDRLGRYDVVIAAIDDGYPNKEELLKFAVYVTERRVASDVGPPLTPKEFDHSRYTFLTSVQQVDGQGVVWFYTRTKNEKIVCREGDELKIGAYSALVRRIDIDQLVVELEVENEVQVLALGQNLRHAQPKPDLKIGSTGDSQGVAPLD